MLPSYLKVDFTIRPAKCIERRMLCDAFRRLRPFGSLNTYRYVGLGSVYFTDFTLLHRALHISDMVSIERHRDALPRLEFNRPFRCIQLRIGPTSEVLQDLDWDRRAIVWLDYDEPVQLWMLDDVKQLFTNMQSGSIAVFTVNAHPPRWREANRRLKELHQELGGYLPPDLKGRDLLEWNTARLYRRVIHNRIASVLSSLNGVRRNADVLRYRQLFNFGHRDTTRMLTLGGIIYKEAHAEKVGECGFHELEFVNDGPEPYIIEAPKLTHRERRFLDQQLPCEHWKQLKHEGLPGEFVEHYHRYYRYLSTFAETEL